MDEIGHYEDLARMRRKIEVLAAEYDAAKYVVPKQQAWKDLQGAKEALKMLIEERIEEERQEWKRLK